MPSLIPPRIRTEPRRVLCAPACFKETLSARDVAAAMVRGIARSGLPLTGEACPIGDGGEGTMDALLAALGGSVRRATVIGPLGAPVEARFTIVERAGIGIVELAEASGLSLVAPDRRDPMRTTTFGTGQLVGEAIARGCREVIVCIGGSATVDGGAGVAQALGARFFDFGGHEISGPLTGGQLKDVARIERPPIAARLRVACDVVNPLLGPNGAAAVYGPQKGATPAQVRELDTGLEHLTRVAGGDPNAPGAGAAGGAGFGLAALCGATLERGIDVVLNLTNFQQRCRGAALVLTGEGRLDEQSLFGKACMGVTSAAARESVQTIAIVGSTGQEWERCVDQSKSGRLRACHSLTDRFGMQRALSETSALVEELTAEVVRTTMA